MQFSSHFQGWRSALHLSRFQMRWPYMSSLPSKQSRLGVASKSMTVGFQPVAVDFYSLEWNSRLPAG
jgi:hypothetical protein